MDRVYAAYQHGLHGKTNVGFEVGCVDCHLKYESEKSISQAQVVGLLWHKAMSGSSSLWGEIRGTMSTPEKQKAMQNELSEKYLKWARSTGFQNCRGCHDLNNFKVNPAKPMVSSDAQDDGRYAGSRRIEPQDRRPQLRGDRQG